MFERHFRFSNEQPSQKNGAGEIDAFEDAYQSAVEALDKGENPEWLAEQVRNVGAAARAISDETQRDKALGEAEALSMRVRFGKSDSKPADVDHHEFMDAHRHVYDKPSDNAPDNL